MSTPGEDEDLDGPLKEEFGDVTDMELKDIVLDETLDPQQRRKGAEALVERDWTLTGSGRNWWKIIQMAALSCPVLVGPVLWARVRRKEYFTVLYFFASISHLIEVDGGVPRADFALQIVSAMGYANETPEGQEELTRFLLNAPEKVRPYLLETATSLTRI